MRFLTTIGTFLVLVGFNATAENPASRLWTELKTKRENLASIHQEFEVSQTFRTVSSSQSSKRLIVLDIAQGRWRERSVAGFGNQVRIFDGKDLFRMEEGGTEFVRAKRRSQGEDPMPSPYGAGNADWSKAIELERQPCGDSGNNHLCVVLEVPLKPEMRPSSAAGLTRVLGGSERLAIDTETGLVISSRVTEMTENPKSSYQSDTRYVLKRTTYGQPADTSRFKLPSDDMHEVKELSRWNAKKVTTQLAGKPAPELAVTDLKGKLITLSTCKGKTVLLDFWTTWCAPCRADGPALDKLYSKYGQQDLMIVGISVSEERAIVEKYLEGHPHSFPIVLTTENDMPRHYQVGVLPTYIVIERDGTVAAAVEGDQGFSKLRKLLKKAGLEID